MLVSRNMSINAGISASASASGRAISTSSVAYGTVFTPSAFSNAPTHESRSGQRPRGISRDCASSPASHTFCDQPLRTRRVRAPSLSRSWRWPPRSVCAGPLRSGNCLILIPSQVGLLPPADRIRVPMYPEIRTAFVGSLREVPRRPEKRLALLCCRGLQLGEE